MTARSNSFGRKRSSSPKHLKRPKWYHRKRGTAYRWERCASRLDRALSVDA